MTTYNVEHIVGQAGNEKTVEKDTVESNSAKDAIFQIAGALDDWKVTDDDGIIYSVAHPDHWDSRGYSDYWIAESTEMAAIAKAEKGI